MSRRPMGVALALLLACGAAAGQAPERRWQVEAGLGAERYDDDAAASWRERDLALRYRYAPRTLAELTLRDTRRYGYDDSEIGLGLALPLATDWSLVARATASPRHRVLARHSGAAELSYGGFGGGWVIGAGLGRSLYDGAGDGGKSGTSTLRMNLERYVAEWRFAGGVSRSRLDGGEHDNGWRAQVDRYFGERGRLGVIVSQGRELENLPPNGAVSTRVRAMALVAAWPIDPDWTLTGALGHTRNSDSERRGGLLDGQAVGRPSQRSAVRVGVQREF